MGFSKTVSGKDGLQTPVFQNLSLLIIKNYRIYIHSYGVFFKINLIFFKFFASACAHFSLFFSHFPIERSVLPSVFVYVG